jgi:hypothetical protein
MSARVFDRYKWRFVFTAAAIASVFTVATGLLFLVIFGAWGLPLFLLPLALAFDRLVMFGNDWLRRGVAERLASVGEPVNAQRDRFVGLAYPCHLGTWRRRRIETDDDVGFLRITEGGLSYHGDALAFEIEAHNIADVRLVRHWPFAPWHRVEVVLADGEPFDTIVFDSRQFASHGRCRRDNTNLYDSLRALLRPARARLTEAAVERLSVTA